MRFLNLLVLNAVILAGATGCKGSAKRQVSRLLSEAKLAALPASATNIAYYQWSGLVTGETYAKFEMSAADMQGFISNSSALQGIKPKIYDPKHQHIPYPTSSSDFPAAEHDYFDSHPKFPSWFDMTIRGNGRKYVIPWGPGLWILMDEDRHIVWLRLIKG